ncbi:serine/threonine-protein kinase [Streptomyces sp. NPDC006197]|uniref:serine/threonine-protein kinase n=1 Tax=Streptomyces sp. NPDC006197 TaxID=3156685 RepID=UPI00339F8EB9
MNDDNGQVLAGRYRLTRLLGQGGMGAVWRAHDERLGREVAVKELRLPDHLGHAERENWIARLDREARAAARLKHPGIITVHDRISGPDGRPWIVMELVDGGSLADLVDAHGALPPRQVADIGLQVAAALDAAHRRGITHRDIKPANILLEDGRVVLTDFGIAALEGDATLTATGMIMGTPAYMAPEQVRGMPATAESDLWSLGATLYAAVEGRAPFEGTAPSAVLVAVATEEPALAVRAGMLGPVLEGLLHKDPGARLTMEQLRTRLNRAVSAPPTVPTAAPASPATPTAPSWSPAAHLAAQPTVGPGPLGPEPAGPPAAAPRGSTRRRRAVLSGAAVLVVAAASVTGYVLYGKTGPDYETNRRAAEALAAPSGFIRAATSRTPEDRERVTYTKDDTCDDLCTGELDVVRRWMEQTPGVASVQGIETALDKCLTTEQGCVIPVTPKSSYSEPTVRRALFRATDGRLQFLVDVG